MVDSGATSVFVSHKFVEQNRVVTRKLFKEIAVRNVDGTHNKSGKIVDWCRLNLRTGTYREEVDFLITDLGSEDMILGLPWLRKVNPTIDWETGDLTIGATELEGSSPCGRVDTSRRQRRQLQKEGILEQATDQLWCNASYTYSTKLAAEARDTRVKTLDEMIPEPYRDFSKVFSEVESERLPQHQSWDHAIDLKPDAPETLRSKVYPMPMNEQEELDRFLDESLRKGYIAPSKSPMASPVFFIKKKDGKLRLIQDYRKLNDITVKNRYPLPLASDIINRLKGAKYFTKFDVRWGYNNIRIRKGDEWKAAFVTSRGLFEPQVMFFGLTNSPATFQTLMNSIFADLIARGVVAVYLDDILIFTEDLDEHRRLVREVLQRLEQHDLYLRPEKCEFERTSVEYLGMVISQGQVAMDAVKVQAVKDWPTPTNLREVRGFLGFANFYRRFIRDFSRLARPLNDLTKKDCPWSWETVQQEAFDQLKERFTEQPILAMWDPYLPTRVEVDASGYATGGVILQKQQKDGLWHPVAYRSESMSEAERNYEIYDREMLAIVRALEDWRHYLEGLPESFEIITDHRNLEYWRTAQHLNRRQARWSLWLSRFDFTLTHKPGKTNTQADPLSRLSSHQVTDADDNQGQVVLKPAHFVRLVSTMTNDELEGRIRDSVQREAEVLVALEALRKDGPRKLVNGLMEWEEKEGLVFYKGRLYVPADKEIRLEILRRCHDSVTAGHPGQHGTLELVTRHYWWPNQSATVAKYVAGCERCQRYKAAPHPRSELHPHDVPGGPWETVGVDLVTGLPKCDGFDAIAVYVDHYSDQCHVLPTHTEVTAEGIADLHYREIFRLHGVPQKMVSDRGPQFAARVMRELYDKLGIQHGLTTAYHPQSNGRVERKNQEVEKYLRLFVSRRQDDWVKYLPTAEFTLNSRINSAVGRSPFEVMYGYQPDFTLPVRTTSKFPSVVERLEGLKEVRRDAEAALRLAKGKMKEQFAAAHVKAAPIFAVGDKVWISSRNIAIHQATPKLGVRQLGPFTVLERVGDLAYRLELPSALKLHPVFHVDRLSKYGGNEVNGERPPPPEPIVIDGEEEYEVEQILDSRYYRRQLQYLVRWRGYGEGDDSWEPARNLDHAQEAIADFHRRYPNAPQRVSAADFADIPWRPREEALTEGSLIDSDHGAGRRPGRPSRTT